MSTITLCSYLCIRIPVCWLQYRCLGPLNIKILLHGFCHFITRIRPKKTYITLCFGGWHASFWGLIRVMIWQKQSNSLFITYLIVISKFDLLLIKLWLFLSFFLRIITQNSCITWGKINSIRKILISMSMWSKIIMNHLNMDTSTCTHIWN